MPMPPADPAVLATLSLPVAQIAPGIYVALGALLLVLIWAVATYNSLVRARNHCDESWSDVDTELKRRYDLIPNLVETVKGYAAHEQETLVRVVEARNQAASPHTSPADQARDENRLTREIRGLFLLKESYPDLKANRNFLALQEELATTENRIQRARRFYNANVRDLANLIESFPSSILAGMYGFTKREFFEIEDASERAVPSVDLS
jgi:LemA protein